MEIQGIIGFQKDIKGGLLFSKQSTLFYLVGQNGVFHDLNEDTLEFLPITEKNEFTAMTLNGKNLLALASKGCTPKLILYNLKSTKHFKLPNPETSKKFSEYVYVSFTEDNEYVAAQGGGPSWPFVMWRIFNRSISGVFVPSRLEIGAKVLSFSFYPKDNTIIVAIGKYFFRIYHFKSGNRFKEDVLRNLERSRKTFHSLTWLPKTDQFAIGTSDGKILIFGKKGMLQEISIEKKLEDVPRIFNEIENPKDKNVTCILSTKKGIICSYGGSSVLCLRWKIDGKDFNIVSSIQVPKRKEFIIKGLKIMQLALNSSEDILAAGTDHGQILTFNLKVPELLQSIGYEKEFNVIMDQQHKTPVVCADTAISKPVHVTCSESDVILWDYLEDIPQYQKKISLVIGSGGMKCWKKMSLYADNYYPKISFRRKREFLLWKSFADNISSVSIHPSGIHLLVGFNKSCKMYNILYNKLEEIIKITTSGNTKVKFSDGGHLMALTNALNVEIYCYQSFQKCAELKENDAELTCILWKNNDSHLLSLNKAGNVYEWDVAEQKKLWSFSSHRAFSTIAYFDDSIYAGTTDLKIWIFKNYQKIAEIDTQAKVTSILITRDMLLAGGENGKISGYRHPFSSTTFFETNFHQRSIINMTLKLNGKLLLATGEEGAITKWKINSELETTAEMSDEVLIEQEYYNSFVDTITRLKRELKEKTDISERKKTELLLSQEAEKTAVMQHYEDIQSQLNQTIIALTEEKYNYQLDMENTLTENIAIISKERDENYADFQSKLATEQENFKKLEEEREKKIEAYERQLLKINEDIENSNRNLKKIKERNEKRVSELELMVQKEVDAGEEIARQDKEFHKEIEEQTLAKMEERKSEFASEVEIIREHTASLTSEVEKYKAMLGYQNEYGRSLNAEFWKKKRMYDELKRIADHIKNRIKQTGEEIQRRETGLEDQAAMTKVLEHDCKENQHLNSENKWRNEECKQQLKLKYEELSKLQEEHEKLKSEEHHLTEELKQQRKEEFAIKEKLMATEKVIADSTQKLLKFQMLLERCRNEFIENTSNIENPVSLRWALLQLYDKRALRKSVKEEEIGDTDPFMKFCRQSEHYESLINTALNKKQEIQASFRNAYVNLAKENSDWTAFAKALGSDIRQKQERIHVLETAVGLPAKDFIKVLPETQKRFNKAYKDLKSIEKLKDEEIEKRMALIETQTNELQRLHGLIVVEESGRVVKMGH